ncbi:MAG: acetyl-CoA carboxylase biotin carboxyl carrier protein [Streptosporangiaceae bacterium]
MELTNEDVTDILALLDSLPYDEFDLQTPRFRLTLRRTPDGWTQSADTRVAPTVVDVVSAAGALAASTEATEATEAAPTGTTGTTGTRTTGPMFHRAGDNRPNVPSGRLRSEADSAGGTKGGSEVSFGATGSEVGGEDAGHGATEADGSLVAVRAPLPGTFYRAPRPGAAPFVEVGSRVGADTVVGIVETMKLFNSVTAGAAGTVAEICLDNAEFADRGATLLRIRAD